MSEFTFSLNIVTLLLQVGIALMLQVGIALLLQVGIALLLQVGIALLLQVGIALLLQVGIALMLQVGIALLLQVGIALLLQVGIALLLQVGIAASYALWAVSSTFTIFVIARVMAGVSKGNISLSTAIVADVATPEKRGKGMVGLDIGGIEIQHLHTGLAALTCCHLRSDKNTLVIPAGILQFCLCSCINMRRLISQQQQNEIKSQ